MPHRPTLHPLPIARSVARSYMTLRLPMMPLLLQPQHLTPHSQLTPLPLVLPVMQHPARQLPPPRHAPLVIPQLRAVRPLGLPQLVIARGIDHLEEIAAHALHPALGGGMDGEHAPFLVVRRRELLHRAVGLARGERAVELPEGGRGKVADRALLLDSGLLETEMVLLDELLALLKLALAAQSTVVGLGLSAFRMKDAAELAVDMREVFAAVTGAVVEEASRCATGAGADDFVVLWLLLPLLDDIAKRLLWLFGLGYPFLPVLDNVAGVLWRCGPAAQRRAAWLRVGKGCPTGASHVLAGGVLHVGAALVAAVRIVVIAHDLVLVLVVFILIVFRHGRFLRSTTQAGTAA